MPPVITILHDFRHKGQRPGPAYNRWHMGSNSILMLAGFLVWAIAGTRVVYQLTRGGWPPGSLADLVAWLGFLAAFLLHVRLESAHQRGGVRLVPLALQAVCAVALASSAGGTGMEIALLVMVAGQLPGNMSRNAAMVWVLAQTGAILLAQVASGSAPSPGRAIAFVGSYVAFQLFAVGAASLAESEREARLALAEAHAQLERLHDLAIESARHAERLRIARDLHDSLGHRLTALGLTLEAARHLQPDTAQAKIGEARELASALMNDLRSSVGEIRDNETPELRSLLEGLTHSVRSPRVEVVLDETLRITHPAAVTALFRMSQEIVTNAARHAGGSEVRLCLRAMGDEARLEGVDNGAVTEASAAGNGLKGIRERAQLLGGDAQWAPLPGGGFRVVVRVPLARLS